MPLVSVIIPTYLHRNFIMQTLESVFAQTFTDFEVIVVNDGSPDDTVSVLRPLIAEEKIRYIEQQNAGQAAARNRGLAEAKGEYIAFLDDDDLWLPDKLKWQVDALDADAQLGVIGGTAEVRSVGGGIEDVPGVTGCITREMICRGCPMLSPGQSLIRRSILMQVGGFDSRIWGADDWDLWLRLSLITRIVIEERKVLIYRAHDGSASRNQRKMLQNTVAVIERNLPRNGDRTVKQLRRDAFRYQYQYAGRRLSERFRLELGRGKLSDARSQISGLAPLIGPSLRDPRLLFWLIRGLMPAAIGNFVTRSK